MSHSGKKPTELIVPIAIQKKAGRSRLGAGRSHVSKVSTLVLVFVLPMAFGAGLLYFLAKNSVHTAKEQDVNVSSYSESKDTLIGKYEDPPNETADIAERNIRKDNAEKRLADFTLAIKELESKGVLKWGGDPYAEIVQLSQEAETFFIAKNYAAASEKYTTAIAKANELSSHLDEAFELIMEQGRKALDEGDGEQAQEKFGVALMIDPANESAGHSLERAKKIETIMQLIDSGKRHEKNADLAFAHADYQEAVKMDPESEEAKNALIRVKNQIKKQAFIQLMSEGLAAFHNKDYAVARDNLLKAKSFEPESREVEDALKQVDQAIRLARIEALRKNALKAENSENWEQALKFHLSVLKLDQNIRFALQGKEWALKNIRIEKRINFFLLDPKALESDIQLGNAVLLAQEIEELDPKGPRLKAQLKELTRLVEAAQTPVKIAIESDNLTDVVVYRVGKLGRFSVRELSLRAGTYIVVGVRDGYKDVRKEIVIKPGQEPLRITVKCKVRI